MNKKYIPIAITASVLLVVGIAVSSLVGIYNGLNAQRNTVEGQWAQVENVMQRRNDLIPNLVSTVKGEMKNEQTIFADIASARQMYRDATTETEQLKADDELTNQTTILLNAIKENYPELASSESVKTLMAQLEGSENRISVERKRYIDGVADYNRSLTSFPNNIIANAFGFQKMDQYKAQAGAEKAPVVDFD